MYGAERMKNIHAVSLSPIEYVISELSIKWSRDQSDFLSFTILLLA